MRRLEQLLNEARADTDAARAEARRLQTQLAQSEDEALRQAKTAASSFEELGAAKAQLTEVVAAAKAEAKRTVRELRDELDGAKSDERRLEQQQRKARAETDAARTEARRLQATLGESGTRLEASVQEVAASRQVEKEKNN